MLRLASPDQTFGECDGAVHRSGVEELLVRSGERGQLAAEQMDDPLRP
jgi:hypothetical protein